jgi:hypothetical protein
MVDPKLYIGKMETPSLNSCHGIVEYSWVDKLLK